MENHISNLRNGLKGVHVSTVEIKLGMNLWQRMISLIEHALIKACLEFPEVGSLKLNDGD